MKTAAATAPIADERRSPATAVHRWLTADYGPLDGRARAVFYLLVLVLGAPFFILTVPAAVRSVPAELFDPAGVLVLGDRATALAVVDALRYPVLAAIAMSAVGLGGRAPLLASGVGSFVMVGAFLSGTGTGHSWHVAVVAMLVLGVTYRPTTWSLDALLARRWPRYPFGRPGPGPDHSATGRKVILIAAVFTLFAGGCAKLLDGGWRWIDGRSIQYFLVRHGSPKGGLGRWLSDAVIDHAWIAVVVSVLTIVIELGSVVTLFSARSRLPYFLVAGGFHVAIWLTMLPQFFPQLATYVLLVPWPRSGTLPRERQNVSFSRKSSGRGRWPAGATVAGLAVAGVVLVATIVGRVESFPLTSIPMYSSYVDDDEVSGTPVAVFGDEALLCAELDALAAPTRSWYTPFVVGDHLELGTDSFAGLDEITALIGPSERYWRDELARDVLSEWRCTPAGTFVGPSPDMPGTQQALRAMLSAVQAEAPGSTTELALEYELDTGGRITLTSVTASGP